MLAPQKYNHPDRTVLNLSAVLLRYLRKHRVASFDNLLHLSQEKIHHGARLFGLSISFLYLIGLVEYHRKNDAFEYRGEK